MSIDPHSIGVGDQIRSSLPDNPRSEEHPIQSNTTAIGIATHPRAQPATRPAGA